MISRAACFALLFACRVHETAPAQPLPLPQHDVAKVEPSPQVVAPGEHTQRDWVALGDEAFSQNHLVDAARFYQEAIRQDSDASSYAFYKLGFIRWNQNDGAAALDSLLHAIRTADAHHDEKIARVARIDIVTVYAQYGRPNAAFNFFRAFSQKPFDTMAALGAQYLAEGNWDAARATYADLSMRDAPNACAYHVRETAAVEAARGTPLPSDAELAARIARCP